MASNYREFFATALSPRWARGYFGERWMGVKALLLDVIAEGFSEALRAPDLYRDAITDDALDLDGEERNMQRYATETAAQYLSRLKTAWTTWQGAGSKTAIETQLGLAGFTGSKVYTPKRTHPVTGNLFGEWLRPPFTHPKTGTSWWSRFWVFVPATAWTPAPIPICGTPGLVASSSVLCGTGASIAVVSTLRSIVKKWRAAHIVCLRIILEETAPTCGTGLVAGSGVICGGITQGIDTALD